MRIEVLGPIRLRTREGDPVEIPERKVRSLLAALTTSQGETVPSDTLIDRIWGEELPAHPTRVLQAKLSQLRRTMDKADADGRALLTSGPGGHRLSAEAPVDARRLQDLVVRARTAEEPSARVALLREALALWGGDPYAEIRDATWLAPEITRLHELRLEATELLGGALLGTGEPEAAIAALEPVFTEHPMRAVLSQTLMLALHRAHRHPDALGVYERHRRHLLEELGADPDEETSTLHIRILQQDRTLDPDPPVTSRGTRRPDEPPTGPPPTSPRSSTPPHDAPPTRLPTFASAFLGRSAELDEVQRRFAGGPLVTVLGVGGVGKTRVAVRAAEKIAERSGTAAWFVDLSTLDAPDAAPDAAPGTAPDPAHGTPHSAPASTSPDRVARLVAEGIGLAQSRTETGDPLPRLTSALQSTGGLLLLDNCEHVADEVARFVTSVLATGDALRVLATSREPLGVPGEQRLPLAPLPVHGDDDAVAFFLDRARAVRPDLPSDEATLSDIAELCRRLDGLPLALELAAAQTAALDVPALLERLSDRLDLLRRPGRGAPRRQQTLRGMLDWSWALLDEHEQILLRRLAVHPASWTLGTIEAVCADDPEGPLRCSTVVPALISLVERSLVTADPDEHGTRYRLLESVGAYAAEQLRASGERGTLAKIHREHWRAEVTCAQDHLFSVHAQDWVRRLAQERTHLRHAFDEAVATDDGAAAVEIILSWFWHRWITGSTTGLVDELRRAAACDGPHDAAHAQVQVLIATLASDPQEGFTELRDTVQVLRGLTPSAAGGGRGAEDSTVCRRERRTLLQVLWFAATPLLVTAPTRAEGLALADEAVAGLIALGDLPAAAVASTQRDWFLLDAGEDASGMPGDHDAEEVLRRHGDAYGLTQALGLRHIQAERDGDRPASIAAASEAVELSRELGALGEEAFWETVRGLQALDAGDLTESRGHLDRAEGLGRRIGPGAETTFTMAAQAELAARDGDADRAARLHERASSPMVARWVRRVLHEPAVLGDR